uniref:Uncharacterized protein n=1 Tax=Arundo donax TaxID=35708 RepID=A0A0A8Z1W7_ARUDO
MYLLWCSIESRPSKLLNIV